MKKKVLITSAIVSLCMFTGVLGIKANETTLDEPQIIDHSNLTNTEVNELESTVVPETTLEDTPQVDVTIETEDEATTPTEVNPCPQGHENCDGNHVQGTINCSQGHENCDGTHQHNGHASQGRGNHNGNGHRGHHN